LLKPQFQTRKVQQRSPWLHGDKKVDVASLTLLTAGDRAEHPDVTRAAISGGATDIVPQLEHSVAKSHGGSKLARAAPDRQEARISPEA